MIIRSLELMLGKMENVMHPILDRDITDFE